MINKKLKRLVLIIGCGLFSVAMQAQSTAINTTGATGNAAAIVDMSANANLGFLTPAVTFTSVTDVSAGTSIPGVVAGTIVYNPVGSGTGLSGPGFYYWSGAPTNNWLFLLNSGTNTAVNSVSGTSPIFTAGTTTVTVSLQGTSGGIFYGTGGGSAVTAAGAQGSMFYNSSANTPGWLGVGGNGTILSSNGSSPAWVTLASLGAVTTVNATLPITASITAGNLSIGLSSPLAVQYGGTGQSTLTSNGVLYGNGTSPVTALTPVNNGVLTSSATNVPQWLTAGSPGNVLETNGSGAPAWTGASSLITVNNGLTNTAGNIQMYGPLVHNTSVNLGNNAMYYDLGTGSASGTGTFAVTNGGTGNTALYVNNSGHNKSSTSIPYGQVGIDNSSPNTSAALDIQSTTGGLLVPRMTTGQQNAITSPATGLIIFNISTNCFAFYGGVSIGWENIACSCTTAPASPTVDPSSPTTVCGGNSYTYAVASVTGATGYTWAPPTGGAIISGQNSGTAAILMPNVGTTTAATITVQSYNSCGALTATQYTITINPSPSAPSLLNGFTSVCQGQSGITYSVTNVAGNSYTWTLPTGFTGSSLSNSIIANVSNTATSGTVTVGALNNTTGCSSPSISSLPVTVNPTPTAPGTIIQTPSSICQGSTGVVYSVTNTPGESYTWTLPTGFTITSPPTASTITVNISNTAVSGNISVIANYTSGSCYSLSSTALAVSLGPPNVPGLPGQSPAGGICIGSSYTYTVAAVTGAANYIWNFPAGSVATNPATTTNPSITVTYTAYPTCGVVTCQSQNTGVAGCTSGVSPALTVSVANTCTKTFPWTGSNITWNVPCGITNVTVMLWGAGGGSANLASGGSGGGGAYVYGTLNVPQDAPLTVIVGSGGGQSGTASFGGGGGGTVGGSGYGNGGSGGGRSAIQYPINTDLVTAGGGGGAGYPDGATLTCNGGGGGGSANTPAGSGAAGSYASTVEYGGGGTPTAGGTAGCGANGLCGDAGNRYTGGFAGGADEDWIGGGGGGGYYGGGGGGSYIGSGGGGGSSYVTNAAFTLITNTGGVTSNNTSATTGAGTGTSSQPGSTGTNYPGSPVGYGAAPNGTGGNGYIWLQY